MPRLLTVILNWRTPEMTLQSVAAALRFWKIAPEEALLAHDELDLAPGAARLQPHRQHHQHPQCHAQGQRDQQHEGQEGHELVVVPLVEVAGVAGVFVHHLAPRTGVAHGGQDLPRFGVPALAPPHRHQPQGPQQNLTEMANAVGGFRRVHGGQYRTGRCRLKPYK